MNWVYFDVETERSAEEVGGWRNIEQLGLAVAVSCATRDDVTRDESTNDANDDLKDADLMGGNKVEPVFKTFRREEVDDLLKELQGADCVVGFNTRGFDFRVLQPFANFDLRALPNFDLMLDLKAIAGFRPGLGNCCEATFGEHKSSNGLESLQWWREGRHQEVIDYCRQDVLLTRRLHEYGAANGHVKCREKTGKTRILPVSWSRHKLPPSALPNSSAPSQQGSLF
jgi:DEAD/DEAH box helicase domain-containing protein